MYVVCCRLWFGSLVLLVWTLAFAPSFALARLLVGLGYTRPSVQFHLRQSGEHFSSTPVKLAHMVWDGVAMGSGLPPLFYPRASVVGFVVLGGWLHTPYCRLDSRHQSPALLVGTLSVGSVSPCISVLFEMSLPVRD